MSIKSLVLVTISIILIGAVLVPACTLNTEENALDVVVIDGQSNAQYWGWTQNNICKAQVVNDLDLPAPSHNLYFYGADCPMTYGPVYSNRTYDTTLNSYEIHSMYENGWTIGGYEPLLALGLSERSGHDTLIINLGVGAASIQWLSPSGPGGIFAKKILDDALDKVPGKYHINMLGVVWIQGENDATTPIATYQAYFDDVHRMFSKYGADQIYIVGTRDNYGGNSIIALNQIIEGDESVHLATNISSTFTQENGMLNPGDSIHYSQQGRNTIASILGEVIEVQPTPDNDYSSLLGVIPLVLLVAIVAALATVLVSRRD